MNLSRLSGLVSRPATLLGSGGRMESVDDTLAGGTDYSHDPQFPPPHDQHDQPVHQHGHLDQTGTSMRRLKPELVAATDQLAIFRTLVGIDHAPGLTTASYIPRPAHTQNIGLYYRVVAAEKSATLKYRIFAFLINACLGLQIIVAASLTALGAGNGPHKVVTAFGAINTVIAGFLTYLKGSGLPNRLRYYQNQWTKLREHIEQLERDFCREACMLDAESEALGVERMYGEVKDDIENNSPDSFVSRTGIQKKLPDNSPPRPPFSREMSYRGPNPITQSSFGQNLSSQYPPGRDRPGSYSSVPVHPGQYPSGVPTGQYPSGVPASQYPAFQGERRVKTELSPAKDKEKSDGSHMA
jgi:SMODS and SLOG-associating 2TM effector domain